MHRKVLMPKLGLTMTEGQISEWLVPAGGTIRAGQGLFVVETDKVATEIAAEGDGVLTEIIVPAGATVAVGEVVGSWQDEAAASSGTAAPVDIGAAPAGSVAPAGAAPRAEAAPAAAGAAAPAARAQACPAPAATPRAGGARILATPLARRLADQLDLSLAGITGSGPRGRIKAADVQAAATRVQAAGPAAPVGTVQPAAAAQPVSGGRPAAAPLIDRGTRSAPGPVQAAMARRLTAVKQQVPHFYLAVEAKVSRLLALRAELNALDAPVRFTLNHFIVAAVGRALCDQPEANRVWDDDEIVSFSSTDVGMAVSTPRGLFVPVVRDAGRLSLTELARQAQAHVTRARDGALSLDDMTGGAITVSNAGMFDVKFMTPIINPGQAMILGVGSVNRLFRPDAQGQPGLCEEMGLVLAADHRLLDGVAGLAFLNRVKTCLEEPLRLLTGV